MFNLYNKDNICVGSFATLNEAKVNMISAYFKDEGPRLATIIEVNDLIAIVKQV